MGHTSQNLAVILIVGLCVAYVAWQIVQAVRGRKSKLGSCCAKGCGATLEAQQQAATPRAAPMQFLPLGNVGHIRRKTP